MNTIVYTSPYVPPEWIEAHGLEPERLIPGRSGEADGPVKALEGVCPFMRLFVNAACGTPGVAGIVLVTVCDQMRHARDILDRETTPPSFLLNVPSAWQTPAAMGLYQAELRRLGRFLETLGGMPPCTSRLVEIMDRHDGLRADRAASFPSRGTRGIPVALFGGPLTRDDQEIYTLVAECGGHVMLDGTEQGDRTNPARFDRRRMKDDPLGELVSAYFGSIPDVFLRPNSELFKWLESEVVARDIRGVILARQVWCDKWHAEVHRFRAWLKVPLLDVDLDGQPCGARTRTRIQAFMESLR